MDFFDPVEYWKNMKENFIEVLWWGNFEEFIDCLGHESEDNIKELITRPLNEDSYAIHILAEFGHIEIIKYLEEFHKINIS